MIAYPLLEAIYLSFFSIYTPTLQGHWVGLENYRAMLASQEFWKALGTNIVWTVGTLTLQVVFGIAMALLLNLNFYFRSLARSLVLFPYFVSTVVAVLVWRWMFNDTLRHPQSRHSGVRACPTCRLTGSVPCRTP